MQDRPTAAELLEAVQEFIEAELLPGIDDPRSRFRALVAINALGIVGRELALGEELLRREAASLARLLGATADVPRDHLELDGFSRGLRAELARRIRSGDVPAGTHAHLVAVSRDALRVASPRSLDRRRAPPGERS